MQEETTKKIKVVAVTAFLFTFLFTGASVDALSYQASTYARMILLVLSVAAAVIVFLRTLSVSRNATLIILLIFVFSILHFPLYELSSEFSEDFHTHIKFSIAAILVTYLSSGSEFSSKIKIYDLAIALVASYLLFLVLISAVTIDGFIPVILYSAIPDADKSATTYSQGVSKIFLVAVIAIVFKVTHEKSSPPNKVGMIVAAVFLFVLSLAGGARGEVIAAIVTLTVIFAQSWKALLLSTLLLILLFIFVSFELENLIFLEQLPSIWRLVYAYESASWGERDTLLLESLALLLDKPRCVFFGCGLGYFQEYYGYEYGRYPHNWVVEFLISYGILVLIPVLGLAASFVVKNYKNFSINERFLVILSCYFFIISLKSGSLLGDALLYGSFFSLLFTVRKPRKATRKADRIPVAVPKGV